jgi:hypothetical protein
MTQEPDAQQQQQEQEAMVTAAPPMQLSTSKVQHKGCTRTQQQQDQALRVLVNDLGTVTDTSSKSPDVVATITLSSAPKAGNMRDMWPAEAGACGSKPPAEVEGSVRRGKPAATAAAQWLASATAAACQRQRQQLQQLVRPTQMANVVSGGGADGGSRGAVQQAEPFKLLEHLLPRVHTVKLVGVR